MKTIKYVFIMLIALVSIIGCSGNYGKTHRQSQSDAKATQKELLNNWTDYNVYINRSYWVVRFKRPFEAGAIVFDPKNDDRKILLGSHWDTVQDRKAWMEIVKANATSAGDFDISKLGYTDTSSTGVREIWGPDIQLYGFIIARGVDEVSVKKVDEKSNRLRWAAGARGSAP